MSYNFKKIMDLDLVTDVPEGANVLIETDGATKRLPSTAINNGYSKEEVYTKEESDAKYLAKSDFNIAPPDMAQNDQTQPDYVKNRTHWSETGIIIEEQNLTGFTVEDPFYSIQNPFTFSPVAGEHYIVHWDGTAYSIDAFDVGDLIYLGNENYVNGTAGGDIPFAIVTFHSDGEVFVVTESTATSHTIAIEGEVIHKLDKKYLPDNIGGGAKCVTIDMDDNGDYFASATYAEIAEWISAGIVVECRYNRYVMHLAYSDSLSGAAPMELLMSRHEFSSLVSDDGNEDSPWFIFVLIDSLDGVFVKEVRLALAPE